MIHALRSLLQTVFSSGIAEQSRVPTDPGVKETHYKGHVIRFQRETEFWVSQTFPPTGEELFLGDRVTATVSEGPEVLIARTRRRITALVEFAAGP